MILVPVLACTSYQLVKYTVVYHAVIRAYSVEELNYELSLQRFTSDATPSAPFDCKKNAIMTHGRYVPVAMLTSKPNKQASATQTASCFTPSKL